MFSLPFFKTFLSNLAFNHLHCCTKMMNPHGQIKLRGESEREHIPQQFEKQKGWSAFKSVYY